MWDNVNNAALIAVWQEFISMESKTRTEFIASGFWCDIVNEWSALYNVSLHRKKKYQL